MGVFQTEIGVKCKRDTLIWIKFISFNSQLSNLLFFALACIILTIKWKYNFDFCTFELYKSQNCTFTLLSILYMLKQKIEDCSIEN
jgi:hypothetical protein